jgi:hypothetical protein
VTPRQLLAREPIRTERGRDAAYWLEGCYFNHLPEAGAMWIHEMPADADLSGLEWRLFGQIYIDHRRYHHLAAVYLHGLPVMIITNAGREGDDHSERFVLNEHKVWELAKLVSTTATETPVVGLDQDLPSMTFFYGEEIPLP